MEKKGKLRFKRILLKISGEALQGGKHFGLDSSTLISLAGEIKAVHDLGVQVAVVVGGGNIFRGTRNEGLIVDRVTGDYMGMLATIINSLALQSSLENIGVYTRVQTAIEMQKVAEPFIRRRAVRHLEKKRVVIFGGGTGNPYFTTDTTAALRASEINADVLMKATLVDGIYDKDPKQFSDANLFKHLGYMEAIARKLKIMDLTAVSLCMENKIPILVFNMNEKGNIQKAVKGANIGTYVS
ncbi:MAG: UMP kinase [Candidatus Aureabacteria bacterium]|nr:UMP kinase [Candidatus Auribacterota bacterium]